MFEQVLTFNSENAKKQRANNKDEDFITRFERSIILPKGKNYKIALLKIGFDFESLLQVPLGNAKKI